MDAPDPILGLTKQQKESMRNIWSLVKKDTKANGLELFIRFFTAYPSYQKLFRHFADVPLSELKSNKKLGAHATGVVYSLASMTENLDDPENVKEIIIKICGDHQPRGVKRQMFEHLGEVLIALLEDVLGNLMTPTAKSAWTKLFDVMATTFEEIAKKRQQ